jgi:hypothetical protein
MARIQKWSVIFDCEVHSVEYTPRTLFSKAKINIDGKEYPLHSAKLFSASQDMFRLGGERAVISIGKDKIATITVDGEEIKEI